MIPAKKPCPPSFLPSPPRKPEIPACSADKPVARSQSRATQTPEEARVGCGGWRRLEQPRTEHRGAEAAGAEAGMGKGLGGAGRGWAGPVLGRQPQIRSSC